MTEQAQESDGVADRVGGRVAAVTGATGFVGRHMVPGLVAGGWRVRALVRSETKARRVLPAAPLEDGRVELVVGDALDERSPARLVSGADACVHLIGIIREAPGRVTFDRMHVRATEAMVRACERERTGMRYLQMSALGARPDGVSVYQRTKFEAERLVLRSRLAWTVFRCGLIHGPDGDFTQMMAAWARGKSAPWLFMPYFTRPALDETRGGFEAPRVAPVYVEDVVGAFLAALDRHESVGEIYNVVGPEALRFDDMLSFVHDNVRGAKIGMSPMGIPGGFAASQARIARMTGMRDALPFDEGMARMGTEDSVGDLTKAREHLGFAPRPFTNTLRAYAEQL